METVLLFALFLYVIMGTAFGIFFVWKGLERVDTVAAASGWAFRLMILPGVIAFWPYLAYRLSGRGLPRDRNRHVRLVRLAHEDDREGFS